MIKNASNINSGSLGGVFIKRGVKELFRDCNDDASFMIRSQNVANSKSAVSKSACSLLSFVGWEVILGRFQYFKSIHQSWQISWIQFADCYPNVYPMGWDNILRTSRVDWWTWITLISNLYLHGYFPCLFTWFLLMAQGVSAQDKLLMTTQRPTFGPSVLRCNS